MSHRLEEIKKAREKRKVQIERKKSNQKKMWKYVGLYVFLLTLVIGYHWYNVKSIPILESDKGAPELEEKTKFILNIPKSLKKTTIADGDSIDGEMIEIEKD